MSAGFRIVPISQTAIVTSKEEADIRIRDLNDKARME
jgi:hypothetical protein